MIVSVTMNSNSKVRFNDNNSYSDSYANNYGDDYSNSYYDGNSDTQNSLIVNNTVTNTVSGTIANTVSNFNMKATDKNGTMVSDNTADVDIARENGSIINNSMEHKDDTVDSNRDDIATEKEKYFSLFQVRCAV